MSTLSDNRRELAKEAPPGFEPGYNGFAISEQTPKSSGKTAVSGEVGPLAGPLETKNCSPDADLQTIIDAWPTLPKVLRAGILAMARGAKP